MTESPDRLNDILCWRDERYVGQQLTFSYDRKRIMLDETEVSRGLVGKYVDTYAWPDGRFEVRWKGFSLPYQVFIRRTLSTAQGGHFARSRGCSLPVSLTFPGRL